MQVSAMKGRLGYLRVLAEKSVDVEDFNGRVDGRKGVVVLAREKGEVEIVEFLKERGAVEWGLIGESSAPLQRFRQHLYNVPTSCPFGQLQRSPGSIRRVVLIERLSHGLDISPSVQQQLYHTNATTPRRRM